MAYIEYDGVRWYPSKRDLYYRNSRRGLLHRWMYFREVGPIPDGMHVHHRNHDKRDNRPDNFILLAPGEHWAEHGAERGDDWHSKGGRAAAANRTARDFTCTVCGTGFTAERATQRVVRYCSNACRDAGAPSRAREQRVCCVCGERFECQRRVATRTCSRRCTSVHAYAQRSSGVRPDRGA